MGNGISEDLKIKIFWGSMPLYPPSGPRLRRSLSICFLCVPTPKNHATPLLISLLSPPSLSMVAPRYGNSPTSSTSSPFTAILSLLPVYFVLSVLHFLAFKCLVKIIKLKVFRVIHSFTQFGFKTQNMKIEFNGAN